MLRVAVKGVLARKLRLLLTSIAVVLGVGFVSGAFILTDSLRASFDQLFTEASQGIDVQVQTKEFKKLALQRQSAGPAAVPIDLSRVGVPPSVIAQIEDVPGIKAVAGTIFELGALPLDSKGNPVMTGGAPAFAANWVAEAQNVGALRISKGRAPQPDEVMLDEHTMKAGSFAIGDHVTVLVQGGRKRERFRISGTVKFGQSGNLNGASITVFETKRAQELFDMGDRFTAVNAQGDGLPQTVLRDRVKGVLGREYDVITGDEFTDEQTESIDQSFLNILQNVILGFAAVAVFVGAFTIFNTFTILVGQRTREIGLLRAIGASRKQVLGIVVLEAFATGIVASTAGLSAGYGVAWLLRTLINGATDGGFPTGPFELRPRTIVACYLVGVLVTLVACVIPAIRASRLSPLEALRANSAHAGRGWKAPTAGAALLTLGAALILLGFTADDPKTSTLLTQIGGGFAIAIIGIALLSRLFIVPVTRLASTVLARGTTGALAARNVTRNRARSATTAAALMIGLALGSLVLVFYGSLGATIDQQIDSQLGADVLVYNTTLMSSGSGTIDQDDVERIRKVDGVDQLVSQRTGGVATGARFDVEDNRKTLYAFDDGALSNEDGLVQVDLVGRGGNTEPGEGVLVSKDEAAERHLTAGDSVQLAFPTGVARTLRVAGVFETTALLDSEYVVSAATFDELEPESVRAPAFAFLRVDDGVRPSTVVRRIKHALGKQSGFLEVKDTEDLRATFRKQIQPILALILGMLSLSLVIALFGIGNTLALNVFERTREIGLLRAVGGTRRQIRRIIRIEAVLIALFGAIVGVVVGVLASYALIRALDDQGFVFSANVGALAAVLVVGVFAGLLASLLPARRAARTDVLAAIAAE